MKRIIFLLIIIFIAGASGEGTVVPMNATFLDGGVYTAPDSLCVTVLGNHDSVGVYTIPGDSASTGAFFSDTLNRDYSSYSTLGLKWKAILPSGDSVIGFEDLTYLLISAGSGPTVGEIYAEFIDGSNEDAFKATVWGSSVAATLQSLVVSNSAGDAVQFTSTGGNGDGLQIASNGSGHGIRLNGGTIGNGIYSEGGSTQGHGIYALGGATGYSGIFASGVGGNSHGIMASGDGTGNDIELGGDGLINGTISIVTDVTTKTGYSLAADQSAVTIGTVNDLAADAVGVGDIETDAINADALAADAVTEIAAGVSVGSTDTLAILALGQNHPTVFYGPTSSGSGLKDYTIYVLDTTDNVMVHGITVSAYSHAGSLDANMNTDDYGKVQYSTDLDSLEVVIKKPGYATVGGGTDTVEVLVTGITDTLLVYQTAADNFCNLYLVYYDGANPVKGATMVVQNNNIATDSTTGNLIGKFYTKVKTDSSGIAIAQVYKSFVYHDSTLAGYDITLRRGSRVIATYNDLWVPDSASYQIRQDD